MAIKLGFGTKAVSAPAAPVAPVQDTSSLETIGQDYLAPLKAHGMELAASSDVSTKVENEAPPIFDLDQHVKAQAPEAQQATTATEAAATDTGTAKTPGSAEMHLFEDEQEKFDNMMANGVEPERAKEAIKAHRTELFGGDAQISQTEAQKLLKMQAAGIDSKAAVAAIKAGREDYEQKNSVGTLFKERKGKELMKKGLEGTLNFAAGNLQTIAQYGGNVLDFATGGKFGFGEEVSGMMEQNKKDFGNSAAFTAGTYAPDAAMAVAPGGALFKGGKAVATLAEGAKAASNLSKVGKYALGVGKTAAVGAGFGAVNPVLQKGSEATAEDIKTGAEIGAATGAGLHLGISGLVAGGQKVLSKFATKEASQIADQAVADFRQGIKPQQRGNKPIDSAAIQRETDSIKTGGDALVRHIEETGEQAPKTLQEAVDTLSAAKKNAARKYSVDGVDAETNAAQKVSEALSSRIEDARKRGVGKEYEKAIKELDEVGGPQTLGQAEDFLANLNKRISTAYKTGDFTGVEALEATRAMYRQELLNDVNQLSGKGAEYAQLRKDWGAMHQLQTQIDRMARLKAGKSAVGLMDQVANLGTAAAIADIFVTGGATAALKVAGLQGAKWYAKFLNSPERGLGNFIDKMQKARAKGYGDKIVTDSVAEAAKKGAAESAKQAAEAEAKAAAQDLTRVAAPSSPSAGPVFKPTGKKSPAGQFTKGADVNQTKPAAPDAVDEFLARGTYVKGSSAAPQTAETSADIVKGWGSTPATILSETRPSTSPAQPLIGYNKPKGPLALPERGTDMPRSVQGVQSRGKKIELPQGAAQDLPHIGETYMTKATPVENAAPAASAKAAEAAPASPKDVKKYGLSYNERKSMMDRASALMEKNGDKAMAGADLAEYDSIIEKLQDSHWMSDSKRAAKAKPSAAVKSRRSSSKK